MSASGRRRRRTSRAAVTAAAVAAAGVAVVAANGFGLTGGDNGGTPAHSTLPPATAQVARQTLVDTQTESGDLGHADTTSVSSRLSGTLTGLPATGSTIERGQPIYHVDDAPVVLLYGRPPAYRALSTGTEGADVKQFEQNLRALGYGGFTVDDKYTASTATAVKEWQEDLGLTETGTVELGRIVYAAGAVRVDSHEASVGDAAQPGEALLGYTGSARVVTVELDVEDQRLAKKGAGVTVTLPDGKTTPGKITKTDTVVHPAENEQEEAQTKVHVTIAIADAKALAGLGDASVEVAFNASARKDVLTVPVAALLALAEGGYGVQVVDGASTRLVAVETGLFASGRVEVSGDGLAEGATVGMPS